MLRRVIGSKAVFGPPHGSIGTTFGITNRIQPFSSHYNDTNRSKTQSHYSSRSAAHHQSTSKSSSPAIPQAMAYKEAKQFKEITPTTHRKGYDMDSEEEVLERDDKAEDHEEVPPHRNVKNHYKDLFKSKPQRLSFKSTFSPSNTKTLAQALVKEEEEIDKPDQKYHADFDDEETDVTKIYSNDEVLNLVQGSGKKGGSARTSAEEDDIDALKSLETPNKKSDNAPSKRTVEATEDILVANNQASGERVAARARNTECVDAESETDSFASVRQQPFFSELLRCVEKNMMRYRKEIRQTNRYSRDLINDCVRPLLQLTDFPFTAHKLTDLTSCINPIILRRSLADYTACKRLHIYRSEDTELLLDWSVEDFLRRRYESIHLSWERMDVVYRRFGWNPDIISDRDCLLYFAEFSEFVELAELEMTAEGKPKAVVILDPVAQAEKRLIPASNLLIRRRPSADVEPSITESVRLMGGPAMSDKASQSPKRYLPQTRGNESVSVSGMFQAVERALEEVEGDEATKFAHAVDSVPSLRQAARPIGRVIREFSIGTPAKTDKNPQQGTSHRPDGPVNGANTSPSTYDPELHESLSNAYHKNKVEVTMLRRRLLNTSNADEVVKIQGRIMDSRKELNRLIDQLRHMRQLKQASKQERESSKVSESDTNKDISPGLSLRSDQPDFPEAPEHELSKNATAAGDIEEDDDDVDISQELKEFESEVSASVMNTTTAIPRDKEGESEEVSGKHDEKWSRNAISTIEEEAVQESDDAQDSTVDAVADTAESEEEAYDRWCREHETLAEEDTVDKASHKLSPSSFTHNPSEVDYEKVSASSQSEELLQLCEKVSSAAQNAREELEELLRQKSLQEAAMAKQVHSATNKLKMLQERLDALRSSYQKACENEAQEAAEAKTRAAEEELRRQREIRQAQLARQREQARVAQMEAQKALAQQKVAEEAVLAAERKLQEVRAQFGLSKQVTDVIKNTKEVEVFASSPATVEKSKQAPNIAEIPATSESTVMKPSLSTGEIKTTVPASTPGGFFMCTPEQYDGMQLAAARLRSEIASLEKQMEQEDDEDDETLMTVLAASRADLEELDACISSVQMHTSWAAERDARREHENRSKDIHGNAESQEIQNQIAQKRFEIGLLERRLHQATERSVIKKLEQGIIEARRQISRLRVEQDRLRQAGTNEIGLSPSISIAKALAYEVKDEAEEMEDAGEISESECSEALVNSASNNEIDTERKLIDKVDATGGDTLAAESLDEDKELDVDPVAVFDLESTDHVMEDRSMAKVPTKEQQKPTTSRSSPLMDADPETQRLHLRLESMLRDIQHLQDSISHQENSTSYDEDETEAVLLEMRKKLSELLRLRDDVQKRFEEAMSGGKDKQDSHTESATKGALQTPPEPPLMASRLTSSIVSSGFKTPSIPIPHLHAEKIRIASASKKLQRSAFKGRGRKQ